MAMFSNQSSFSQQIGGQIGTGPMGQPQSMANPYPTGDMSTKITGGAAMALPGIATGVGLAGGLMGGAAGWADPMTGIRNNDQNAAVQTLKKMRSFVSGLGGIV